MMHIGVALRHMIEANARPTLPSGAYMEGWVWKKTAAYPIPLPILSVT